MKTHNFASQERSTTTMSYIFKQLYSFSSFIIFIALATLSIIIVYPILLLVFVPFFIYRQAINTVVHIIDPKCGNMITGLSAVLTGEDPYSKPLFSLSPFITFVTELDRDNIVKVMNDQIIRPNVYPELKQRIVRKFGYWFWYPVEKFDLENHVKYLNPDCPEKPVTRRQLRLWVLDGMKTLPFGPNLSPWDIVVIPKLIDESNPAVKSAVYFRANHCLMDGYSIIDFISKCGLKPWTMPAAQTYLNPKRGFRESMKKIFQLIKCVLIGPYYALNGLLFSNDKNGFLKRALTPVSPEEEKWRTPEVEPRRIDGGRLKGLRKKLNASVPSILMTMSVEAIIRFMKLKCNQKFSELPGTLYIQMAFPFPGHPGTLTNHWTTVRFFIEVSKESDPLKLLASIHNQYEYFKHSVVPLVNFLVPKFLGFLPTNLHPCLEDLLQQTILLTNVPGPEVKADTFGYEWDSSGVSGSPPIGSAFCVPCQFYNGKFWIDFGGVRTVFKSQEDLVKVESYVHDVLNELEIVSCEKKAHNS